jgi:uncharacterized protein (TIGR03643 family)
MTFEELKQYDVSKTIIPKKSDCIHRLIEMAWQDRTPFEAIEREFGMSENQVKRWMKSHQTYSSFKRWRARVQGRSTKHSKKLLVKITRFQGPW